MSCLVCLKTTNSDHIFNIFHNENQHYNAVDIISKHLWFQPTENSPTNKAVCHDCWHHLYTFHQFYTKVEEAHQRLSVLPKMELHEFKNDMDNLTTEIHDFHSNADLHSDQSVDFKSSNEIEDIAKKTESNFTCGSGIEMVSNSNSSDIGIEEVKQPYVRMLRKRNNPKIDCKNTDVKNTCNSNKTDKRNVGYNSEEIDKTILSFVTLTCDICGIELGKFSTLKGHFRKEHNKNGYAVCCKKRYFKRCLLLEHINSHINPEYFKCSQCDKIMSSKETLRKHVIKVHNPNISERIYLDCDQCNKKFCDKVGLVRHQATHVPQDQWTWKCEECNKICASKFLLKTHINDYHRNKRMCQVCGQVVQNKRFKDHMTKHIGVEETRVQCHTCGAWMKSKKYLQVHMAKHIESSRTHTCTICGKLSPNSKALNIHMKYTHSEQKKHECSICHKTFKRPLVLKQHIAGHTGNPLYSCTYCPRTFIYDSHYHNHRKKAHREQWEADKEANKKLRTNFLKVKNNEIESDSNLSLTNNSGDEQLT